MSPEQSASTVFDTGVLLELAVDSPQARETKDAVVGGTLLPVTGELNVAELSYVLCRKVGEADAERTVALLLKASQVKVLPASEFLARAAEIKCSRSMSFVDCVTVAMGEVMGAPVLFARRERELSREISRSAFGTKLLFMHK